MAFGWISKLRKENSSAARREREDAIAKAVTEGLRTLSMMLKELADRVEKQRLEAARRSREKMLHSWRRLRGGRRESLSRLDEWLRGGRDGRGLFLVRDRNSLSSNGPSRPCRVCAHGCMAAQTFSSGLAPPLVSACQTKAGAGIFCHGSDQRF